MPIMYPGTTVPNWIELMPTPDFAMQLHDAIGLLMQTFPGRYDKYSVLALRNKMTPRADVDSIPGLRVWVHTTARQGMAAFFFLRNRGEKAPAYALSVGVDPGFNNANTIYTELQILCAFMANQGNQGLEIVNDLATPAQGHAVLTDVIDNHANTPQHRRVVPDQDGPIHPDKAWPRTLNRWIIDPNA